MTGNQYPNNQQNNWWSEPTPQPPKKQNRLPGVALVALCLVCSTAFGFVGGYAANRLATVEPESSSEILGSVSLSEESADSRFSEMASSEDSSADSAGEGGVQTVNTVSKIGTEPLTTEEISALVADSVVEITTETVTTDGRLQQYVSEGAGSGVIISADGYLITNNHVIDGASKITVRLRDGTTYPAKLIGTDAQTDIAVVKIEASGLTAAVFGDSDKLVVGEFALAIGNPLGSLGGTVTDGIISALSRTVEIDGQSMNLLQTNAAINPGNSGGGLFNQYGELIGIVNAKSSGSGIEGLGFAIPINTAKNIADQLISLGYVAGRVSSGMTFVDVSDYMTAMMYGVSRTGVYVSGVNSGSSAEQAGFEAGDCIVSIDGQQVSSSAEITAILNNHEVGDELSLLVIRGNRQGTLTLTLEQEKGTGIVG